MEHGRQPNQNRSVLSQNANIHMKDDEEAMYKFRRYIHYLYGYFTYCISLFTIRNLRAKVDEIILSM